MTSGNGDASLGKGLIEATAGEWAVILSFIFGGCCSNVWALEALLRNHPDSGTFLTFAQFLYVTIQNLSSQLEFPSSKGVAGWIPRLKKREVPLRRWLIQVTMFLSMSLMNNFALGMRIPMTVHIIFRSGGLCVSMLTGYFVAGKRYSLGQILAGLMITSGITVATMSAPRKKGHSTVQTHSAPSGDMSSGGDGAKYVMGVSLLAGALFLSSLLGLWQEETYKRYGKQWREGLFYSHFLSLPFFIPFYPSLSTAFTSFVLSPPLATFTLPLSSPKTSTHIGIPSGLVALFMNVFTQGLCVKGVNRLTARVSSTTVNLVLTLRKAFSLAISVWYYGSGMTPGLLIGGLLVLVGTVLYSMSSSAAPSKMLPETEGNGPVGKDVASAHTTALNGQRPPELRQR